MNLEPDLDAPPPSQGGMDTWLTSYGDLMTILLVFFALLISVAAVSSVKFDRLRRAFQGPRAQEMGLGMAFEVLEQQLQELGVGEAATVAPGKDDIRIVLNDRLLFDLGSELLRPESLPVLETVSHAIRKIDDSLTVSVEGHTDDNPVVPSRYRSNYHLSAMRALSVFEVLDREGACRARCEIRGFGARRPREPNRTPEGRAIAVNQAKNRRVVIRVY